MKREIKVVKVRTREEMRRLIMDCLMEHSEIRSIAMRTSNLQLYFYEQGWMDALRTLRDALSEEGLILYRFVEEEKQREEYGDRSVQ